MTKRTKTSAEPQAAAAAGPRQTKIGAIVKLLCRHEGATIAQMMEVTGWQRHSVRGALSGAVKKDLGLNVVSQKTGAERVYRIVAETQP
jgi:hypothetical protein